MTSKKNFLKELIIFLGILFGLNYLYFLILGMFGIYINNKNPSEIDTIIFLYSTIAQILAGILFVKYELKKDLSYIWVKKEKFFKNALAGFLIGFIQMSIYVLIVLSLNFGRINYINGFSVKILILLFGFFIQSSSEEFLVRGLLTRVLLNKFDKIFVILIPSIVFGALHLFNDSVSLLSTVNTILVGIFYGLLIIAFKNIWLVSFAHMAWNFSMAAIYGLTVSGIDEIKGIFNISITNNFLVGSSYGPEESFLVTIIEIISIILVLIYARKRGVKWIRK